MLSIWGTVVKILSAFFGRDEISAVETEGVCPRSQFLWLVSAEPTLENARMGQYVSTIVFRDPGRSRNIGTYVAFELSPSRLHS